MKKSVIALRRKYREQNKTINGFLLNRHVFHDVHKFVNNLVNDASEFAGLHNQSYLEGADICEALRIQTIAKDAKMSTEFFFKILNEVREYVLDL